MCVLLTCTVALCDGWQTSAPMCLIWDHLTLSSFSEKFPQVIYVNQGLTDFVCTRPESSLDCADQKATHSLSSQLFSFCSCHVTQTVHKACTGHTKQAVGQVWPWGCRLLAPDLKHRLHYNCTLSTLRTGWIPRTLPRCPRSLLLATQNLVCTYDNKTKGTTHGIRRNHRKVVRIILDVHGDCGMMVLRVC